MGWLHDGEVQWRGEGGVSVEIHNEISGEHLDIDGPVRRLNR
jgi:hypothetical protein